MVAQFEDLYNEKGEEYNALTDSQLEELKPEFLFSKEEIKVFVNQPIWAEFYKMVRIAHAILLVHLKNPDEDFDSTQYRRGQINMCEYFLGFEELMTKDREKEV